MKTQTITRITLWVNRLVFSFVIVSMFLVNVVLDWYSGFRYLAPIERTGITAGYFCCVPVIAVALVSLELVMRSVLKGQVLIRENVQRASLVRWCCGVVALICVPVTVCYLPLIFVTVIMAFLCLVLSVVVCTLDAAVTIREENDLTI